MGTISFSTNEYKPFNAHTKSCKMLVYGYIRHNMQQRMPTEIITLCITFYYQINHQFLLLCGRQPYMERDIDHKIQIYNMYTKRNYKLKTKNTEKSQNSKFWNKKIGQAAWCYIQNIAMEPTKSHFIQSINPIYNKQCHALFRFGGRNGNGVSHINECNMYLFHVNNNNINNNDIDAYHYQLPAVDIPIETMQSIYNENKNEIYCVGGRDGSWNVSNLIRIFNLDTFKWTALKTKMKKVRNRCALSMVNNNLIIMGGWDNKGEPMKSAEIYCFNLMKSIKLTDMLRLNGSSAATTIFNDQVVVGGGCFHGNRLEILDLNKNKWKLLGNNMIYQHKYPCLWSDNFNENIIYIAGDEREWNGASPKAVGYIEFIDIREGKWRATDIKPIADLFNFTKEDEKTWRCITLLI